MGLSGVHLRASYEVTITHNESERTSAFLLYALVPHIAPVL